MNYSHDLQIQCILGHEKTSTGVFLEVLFDEGQKASLSLNLVMEISPQLASAYLLDFPELYLYHQLYYK